MNYRYNIYKHISNEELDFYSRKLKAIVMTRIGVTIDKSFQFVVPRDSDALGITYRYIKNDGFEGAIGIYYEDNPEQITFVCGVIKTLDIKNLRYYKKMNVCENASFDEIEANLESLFDKSLNCFFKWNKEELADFIVMKSL